MYSLTGMSYEDKEDSKLAEFRPKFGPWARFKRGYLNWGIIQDCCYEGCDYESLYRYCAPYYGFDYY
jgi:hypothetical protein